LPCRASWGSLFCAGLRRDDLIAEEHEVVQEALNRLSKRELYDRNWRLLRAIQLQISNNFLPKEEWTKPEEVSISRVVSNSRR
jgi:hypothetical protein